MPPPGGGIAITRNSRKSQNSFSGEIPSFELSFFAQYVKTITQNFIMTHGRMLGGENSEF